MAMSGQLMTRPLCPLATALDAQYMGGWVRLQRRCFFFFFFCGSEQMSPRLAQSLYRHCSIEFVSRLLEITHWTTNLSSAACVPTELRTCPGQYVFPLNYEFVQGSMCSHWTTNLPRAVCVPTELRTCQGQHVFPLNYELAQGSMCSHWTTNLSRAVCVPTELRTWPAQSVVPLKYEPGQDPVCPQQYNLHLVIPVQVVTAWPNLLVSSGI